MIAMVLSSLPASATDPPAHGDEQHEAEREGAVVGVGRGGRALLGQAEHDHDEDDPQARHPAARHAPPTRHQQQVQAGRQSVGGRARLWWAACVAPTFLG